jgi:hypothetical protein
MWQEQRSKVEQLKLQCGAQKQGQFIADILQQIQTKLYADV